MSTSVARLLPDGHPKTGLQPVESIDRAAVISGEGKETWHLFYKSDDEKTLVGIWECTPVKERIDSYPVDEMMTVLKGSVTLTDEAGHAETFTSGDTFFVPRGFKGTWEITETLRKYFMIVE